MMQGGGPLVPLMLASCHWLSCGASSAYLGPQLQDSQRARSARRNSTYKMLSGYLALRVAVESAVCGAG